MSQILIQLKLDVYCIFYLFICGDIYEHLTTFYMGVTWGVMFLNDQSVMSLPYFEVLKPSTLWLVNIFDRFGMIGLGADQWFFAGTLVAATNKTDRHDIAEIVLKVVLNTITP